MDIAAHVSIILSLRKIKMEPRAYRPLHMEYSTVGYILRHEKSVYEMTQDEFIAACMVHSHGAMHPVKARTIYNKLMGEAGL